MMNPSDKLVYERASLVPRGMDGTSARKVLQSEHKALSMVAPGDFDVSHLSKIIAAQMEASQVSSEALLSVLRVAITGSTEPADIYEAMELLGKGRTMRRLEYAIRELMVVA